MPTNSEAPTAGCGCQFDAAGRVFVDRCVCPALAVDIVGGVHTDPGDTEPSTEARGKRTRRSR